jgi:uncharacterized sporulation protein YeaH/YhbH (DUF444 family)
MNLNAIMGALSIISNNIYHFHFSDGDSLTSYNTRCIKLVEGFKHVWIWRSETV